MFPDPRPLTLTVDGHVFKFTNEQQLRDMMEACWNGDDIEIDMIVMGERGRFVFGMVQGFVSYLLDRPGINHIVWCDSFTNPGKQNVNISVSFN